MGVKLSVSSQVLSAQIVSVFVCMTFCNDWLKIIHKHAYVHSSYYCVRLPCRIFPHKTVIIPFNRVTTGSMYATNLIMFNAFRIGKGSSTQFRCGTNPSFKMIHLFFFIFLGNSWRYINSGIEDSTHGARKGKKCLSSIRLVLNECLIFD